MELKPGQPFYKFPFDAFAIMHCGNLLLIHLLLLYHIANGFYLRCKEWMNDIEHSRVKVPLCSGWTRPMKNAKSARNMQYRLGHLLNILFFLQMIYGGLNWLDEDYTCLLYILGALLFWTAASPLTNIIDKLL